MKKALFILISLLIGIGLALIALELFLRLNPKFGYVYNSFKFRDENPWIETSTSAYLRPSALLSYEFIPNCNPDVNSYGLIGRQYRLKKDKDTFRILLLGDSIASTRCAHEFLEERLNGNPSLHSRYKFEIWNAGCPGYDIRRYYLYLTHRGLKYKPDMVIIYFCMNDFSLNTNIYYKARDGIIQYVFPISEISKHYEVNSFLMEHSYLYRFTILRLDTYLSAKKKKHGIELLEENGRYYLEMIKDVCESRQIPLFVIIFPYLKPLKEYHQIFKVGADYQIDEYNAICSVTKDLKVNYLNLYEHLPEEDLYGLRNDPKDEMHPKCDAFRLVAKLTHNFLLDKFFKDKCGSYQ